MRTTKWMLVLAALAFAGCGGDDESTRQSDPFLATLAGSWTTGCVREAGAEPDYVEDMTFSGTSVTFGSRTFGTNDGTCGGTPTVETFDATFALGGEVTATIGVGGPSVTARAVDVNLGVEAFYTIAYVDTAATPDVLYLGDEVADPARDGTTAARRPVVLQDWKSSVKQ